MSKYTLVKKESFSLNRAETDVWYELWQHRITRLTRREVFEPVKMRYETHFSIPLTGGLAWAKRIAKHYKIEVPK